MAELLQTPAKTILIASSSIDRPTWEPVATELAGQGYDVVTYEADKVAQGTASLDVKVDNKTGLSVAYDGRALALDGISAAWYRRSTLISNALQADRSKQIGLDSERKVIQAALWDTVPDRAWLNSPEQIRYAEKKLTQLLLAREVGFDIPDTVATNRWATVLDSLPREIVFKTSYPYIMFCENTDLQMVYTTPLQNDKEHLPTAGNPFPGFWQERRSKAREWRITAVGDETFDAAIYTTDKAKDDWRKHQSDSGQVEFRAERFPDEHKVKCFKYLGKTGLRFGAFDFIEEPDGRMTFLECNANGQFGWLEDKLGLPISSAIASELAATANAA